MNLSFIAQAERGRTAEISGSKPFYEAMTLPDLLLLVAIGLLFLFIFKKVRS